MNVNRIRQNNDVDLIRRFANYQAQAGGWITYSAETIRIQTQEACSIITPENASTLYNFFLNSYQGSSWELRVIFYSGLSYAATCRLGCMQSTVHSP